MTEHPTLYTEHLIVRPYSIWDAEDLQRLMNDKDIASKLINVPYPYSLEDAIDWISQLDQKYKNSGSLEFAITHKDGFLIGGIGLRINTAHENGEIFKNEER